MRFSRLFASLLAVSCGSDTEAQSTGDDGSSSSGTTASTTTSATTTSQDESGPAGDCGNAMVEGAEACDDGNQVESDGCSTTCRISGSVEWERTLDGAAGWAVAPGVDGEVVVAGIDVDEAIFLGTWNLAGDATWQLAIPGVGALARAHGVVVDDAGAIFAVGVDGTDGDFDGFVRRITAPDTVVWTTPFGTPGVADQARDVARDPAGMLVVAGYGDSGGATGVDVWIARVDPASGEVMETIPIALDGDDTAFGLDIASNGDIALVGSVPGMAGGTDLALWKLAPDGTVTWTQTADGDDADRGDDAAFDPATGDILVAGTVNSNIWLRRYAPDGNDTFTKTVDSGMDSAGSADEAGGIAIDEHGNIVVTGTLAAPDTSVGWTRKWSPDAADELWTVELTGSAGTPTSSRAVTIGPDSGVYAAGSEGDSVWVVRYTG